MTAVETEQTEAAPLLRVSSATKAFVGVAALQGVSIELHSHRVHAIVGENGAGKSTLIKIMTGAHRPDSGSITIDGVEFDSLSASRARGLGIAAIYQEFTLLPDLTVAENIFLGSQPRNRFGLLDTRRRRREARRLLEDLGIELNPARLVATLTVGEQQIVEIAKALALDARVLIMDEPSAVLPTHDLDRLFAIIDRLRERGSTIVYISHRLSEVFAIADEVTVLKDGKSVATLAVGETTQSQLIELMVGRPFAEYIPPSISSAGDVALEVRDLAADGCTRNISFDVREGEIVGLAGLGGSGRTTVARALVGLAKVDSGEIRLLGAPGPKNPTRAAARGLVLVPEDRAKFGLAPAKSIGFNITLPAIRSLCHLRWFVDRTRERGYVAKSIAAFNIRTSRSTNAAETLSGGNQQKVVLAKWLSMNPKVVILDEPTRGIDVGAKAEVYTLIRDLTSHGVAVVVASSDLPELIGLSDRVVVLHEGTVAGELPKAAATEANIVELATGSHLAVTGTALIEESR
jgi:ABC-type sugar transport system ATPase subunit